ncbi:tetratricopeptide repeat protein [Mucilaginibacter sp. UYCu711]|uniref:tetratricopeptide repeat protein n=1 Tax=Mucilaginibacter sp. UYCu711 TaxID=3156339 RepID=UPI003D1A9E83
MISKIAKAAIGLVFIGSAVFGQSLADAKKAIDAEQYQKAKGMLKNLTVTQPTSDENFFYLGWVYLIQDYADSAKTTFTKGIAVDPKSAINYVGLGAVALQSNDDAGATSNFNQAITLTQKKDSRPYLYIGKAYLIDAKDGKFPPAKANAAIDALTKGKTVNPKDAEIMVALGNAYRSQLKSNEAYDAYQAALTLDPKSPSANVAEGVLWKYADNFESSEKQFAAAIAIDPNFGPAYRELAETNLTQAQSNIKVASVKVKEGVENYKKYLSLTDESVESLLRYADFLVNAGDYVALQEVTTKLSKSGTVNPRIYRYLGYAAYENKDYSAGFTALNNWFAKAQPNRILPRDYLYLGHLQIASGKDTLAGIASLKKAAELDTNKTPEIYAEIANVYKAKGNYLEYANTYEELINKVHGKPLLTEHANMGIFNYLAFTNQVRAAKTNPAIKPDSTLLTKADSALSFVQQHATAPILLVVQYRAYIADQRDAVYATLKGLAKPYYEQIVQILTAKPSLTDKEKSALADAYASLGNNYQYHDKDDAKALEAFEKARELDPNNRFVKFYFDNHPTTPATPATPATPKKAGTK